MESLHKLKQRIVECRKCPRLVGFRESVACTKRKQFMDWDYWGKPVPGYGSHDAKLLIVGLAPAAHGGNRTGRVFTGDKSAEFLFKCMYDVGLSNQPNSHSLDDGLLLKDSFMTPVLKCVPPEDKPKSEELKNCLPYFDSEINLLQNVRCILSLGKIAFDGCLKFWRKRYDIRVKDYPFRHENVYKMPDGKMLIGCYHPSPRNVNTKRLTHQQMVSLLKMVKRLAGVS